MSIETVHNLNMLLGIGVIILQILSLLALLTLLFRPKENKYLSFIKNNFLEIGFIIALLGTMASLFYSEILNYVPCMHCWIQRIFIYPQVVLFGVAWLRKERSVFWYSLPLLLIGFVDAIYLYYIYYFNPSSAPCDASGVSCVQHLVSEFGGYISIPSISLTGFASLLTLLAVVYYYRRENI